MLITTEHTKFGLHITVITRLQQLFFPKMKLKSMYIFMCTTYFPTIKRKATQKLHQLLSQHVATSSANVSNESEMKLCTEWPCVRTITVYYTYGSITVILILNWIKIEKKILSNTTTIAQTCNNRLLLTEQC